MVSDTKLDELALYLTPVHYNFIASPFNRDKFLA